MSIEAYEEMIETARTDAAISEAEKEYAAEGVLLDAREALPLYGGSILDNYVVKLYARAYRDLDGIYTYIAENLLEPGTALNMVDELEKAILAWSSYRNAVQSAVLELMLTEITASCSLRIMLSSTVC